MPHPSRLCVKVEVRFRGSIYIVRLVANFAVSREICEKLPWHPRITLIDVRRRPPASYEYRFEIGRSVCQLDAAELQELYQKFFDVECCCPATNKLDTRHLPNEASEAVGQLMKMSFRGNRFATDFLRRRLECWETELRHAIADIQSGSVFCKPDERHEHMQQQYARIRRRTMIIPCVRAFLSGDYQESKRIAARYSLY